MKNIPLLGCQFRPALALASVALGVLCGCQVAAVRKDPITILAPRVEAGGKVTVNGVDPNRPQKPFTWNWGDGHTEIGWFPLTHIYEDTKREYVLTVTAYYDDGQTGQERATISFRQKEPNKAPEPTPRPVTIRAEPRIAPVRGVAHL